MLHSAQAPGEAERPATRLIEWGENMLGHSGTLSQTLPLIDKGLLSPPARLPVDVLYINLSHCSALIVTAPCTAASINPLYPSSHQSIKALTPPSLFCLHKLSTLEPLGHWAPLPLCSLVIEQGPSSLTRTLQSSVSLFSRGLRGLCPCTGSLLYNDSPLY